MDVVHHTQARHRQESTGEQIDAAAPGFFLSAGPGAGVNHLDLQSQLFAEMLQQFGIGTDQLAGVGRVTPQIRRILRIAGGHQFLAGFLCLNRQVRQRQEQRQPQRFSAHRNSQLNLRLGKQTTRYRPAPTC